MKQKALTILLVSIVLISCSKNSPQSSQDGLRMEGEVTKDVIASSYGTDDAYWISGRVVNIGQRDIVIDKIWVGFIPTEGKPFGKEEKNPVKITPGYVSGFELRSINYSQGGVINSGSGSPKLVLVFYSGEKPIGAFITELPSAEVLATLPIHGAETVDGKREKGKPLVFMSTDPPKR